MANRGFGSRALSLALTLALALTLTLMLALTPLRLWLPLRLRLRLAAIDLGAAVLELAPPMALPRRFDEALLLGAANREPRARLGGPRRCRCAETLHRRDVATLYRRDGATTLRR